MNAGMPRNEHHKVVCHFRLTRPRLPPKVELSKTMQGHNLSLLSSSSTASIICATLSELLKYFLWN